MAVDSIFELEVKGVTENLSPLHTGCLPWQDGVALPQQETHHEDGAC